MVFDELLDDAVSVVMGKCKTMLCVCLMVWVYNVKNTKKKREDKERNVSCIKSSLYPPK